MKLLPNIKLPQPVMKLVAKGNKYAPEICIASGLICFTAAVIKGCRTTATKAHLVIDEHKTKVEEIKKVREDEEFKEEYSDQDYRKDLTTVYMQTAWMATKTYASTAALMTLGTGFILVGYRILKKRNLALIAAYTALQSTFDTYRQRVIDDVGEEKDTYYQTGKKKEKIEVTSTDENGKEKKRNEIVDIFDNKHEYSQYARFFDESSKQWHNSHEYNLTYLMHQQSYANDMLHSRGHVFLNEIYDMLGFPHTQAGAVVGWVEGNGDNYVDFGIHEGRVESRRFVNGWENTILLDFNVDGVIVDKI